MLSTCVIGLPEELDAPLVAIDAAVESLLGFDAGALTAGQQLALLRRLEHASRRLSAVGTEALVALDQHATAEEVADTVPMAIASALRITPAEAHRRLHQARDLTPKYALTGQALPARLHHSAIRYREGRIGTDHINVIREFLHRLPNRVDPTVREDAERDLGRYACGLRPDQLRVLARHLELLINPDGILEEADRQRRRGFTWAPQGAGGLSEGRLTATPELRAVLDAAFAKLAAPGMCNPADQSPQVDGEPSEQAAAGDARSVQQRQHDALLAIGRAALASDLGTHRGLPATVIASTTLDRLQAAADQSAAGEKVTGWAATAGGTLIPMADLLRMATRAYNYLAIFDTDGRPLDLFRSKRIATADQRIMLHAKDRGCTFPGCDKPGYLAEVHHIEEWVAEHGPTNIDLLTFVCRPHHGLIEKGWKARKRADGITEWIPPPQLELPTAVNDYHHPERLLGGDGEDCAD
ncbi:HNH endonuclease signature motif containing protein [soil metagenome]